jgi:hypothetical protein
MQGLLDWAGSLKDWFYNQSWFSNMDYLLSRPSYDSFGLVLVIVIFIAGVLLIVLLGRRSN